MTLVVARIDGPRVAIASDTLLIEHDKPLPFQSGIVKSCMRLPYGGITERLVSRTDTHYSYLVVVPARAALMPSVEPLFSWSQLGTGECRRVHASESHSRGAKA
jgi:hypothetical protein